MKQINFSESIKQAAPGLKVLQIEAEISNPLTSEELWNEILEASKELAQKFSLSELNKRPSIAGTRKAYKNLGKDPNRYRPSAEALGRRIIQGKGIYRLTTLVDIINLISIKTGYSIGGFDMDKIDGDSLTLHRGNSDDVFSGIGRGILNIEGLPVYKDSSGGIGTPTSDEERTKLTESTKRLLMLVNIYEEETAPEETINITKELLQKYADLSSFESRIILS